MNKPEQESTPVIVMTGTREHRAFLTCNGHAFTVPKECGAQIVHAVNSHAATVAALELAAPILDSLLNGSPEFIEPDTIDAALLAVRAALRAGEMK